jgi:hypothetical protein
MAIRAQKIALACLRTHRGDRPRKPAVAQSKPLCAWVAVVELEGRWVAVVTTDHAATPGFRNKNLLHPTPPPSDLIGATLRAAVVALRVEHESTPTVGLAFEPKLGNAGGT